MLDENIPAKLRLGLLLPAVHATDLSENPSDTVLWQYAREHELVIVTKDADFSDRVLLQGPPPWVVQLKCGNMRWKEFRAFMEAVWPQVEPFLPAHKLVRVYPDRIEAVGGEAQAR